jgi:hypothetical protein
VACGVRASQADVLDGLYSKMAASGDDSVHSSRPFSDSLVAAKLIRKLTSDVEAKGGVERLRDVIEAADTNGDGPCRRCSPLCTLPLCTLLLSMLATVCAAVVDVPHSVPYCCR